MQIKGNLENIIFRNDANGYSVICLECAGEPVTCVGYFPPLNEGMPLTLEGEYKINPRFGMQFCVATIVSTTPDTQEEIVRYLSGGLIKGVGPKTALAIVQKFGLDTIKIIEENPSALTKVKGISKAKAEAISAALLDIKIMQDAVMFLQKYDISLGLCLKIFHEYGVSTKEILLSNPYKLIEDIDGVGFVKADIIAQKLGIEPSSPFRIRAGLVYVLKDNSDKRGNTCMPLGMLLEQARKLLELDDKGIVMDVVNRLVVEQVLRLVDSNGQKMAMLSRLYFTEKSIATKIVRLLTAKNQLSVQAHTDIAHFEQLNDISFDEQQKNAIIGALNNGVSIITGGPGTGKTTIIKCVSALFNARGKRVLLCAPTGRAAKRLALSTDSDASTIHRALGFDGQGGFSFNELNKLDADVIIVDEVSMVDVYLMNSLLKAINEGASLVLVGDKDQLPSVGAGNLLSDLITSGMISVSVLKYIYRQQDHSLIVSNAHRINNGDMPVLTDTEGDFFYSRKSTAEEILETVCDMVTRRIPAFKGVEPKRIQVLAALKNGVAGVDNLNARLQQLINPHANGTRYINCGRESKLYLGDKVMQIVNNYEITWERQGESGDGVYNGDLGYIVAINPPTQEIRVEFEDGRCANYNAETVMQLTLAYAITVHKSQGCEFDIMVMAILGGSPHMMTRNLLYTAVTRAKKMAVLVGEEYNIKRMVQNNYSETRYSLLKDLLPEGAQDYNKLYKQDKG